MGFIRMQEERMAAKLLAWHYERIGVAVPDEVELEQRARQLVDDAHRIAKERGKNVVTIVKELIADLKK